MGQLCRYITRPAVVERRLSLTEYDRVCYEMKTPYLNGTTHMSFASLERVRSQQPVLCVGDASQGGRGAKRFAQGDSDEHVAAEGRVSMSLKRNVSNACSISTNR